MIKILVTGDRKWGSDPADRSLLWTELYGWLSFGFDQIEIIEGCARGADSMAEEWARAYGVRLHHYPADWDQYGRAAGPIRNRRMADTKPDIVLAFHRNILASSGTRDMIGIARGRDIPVRLFPEDQ